VGRHGVISIDHAMAALGVGLTAAYRRVAACIDGGLLERLELQRHQPSLLRATRRGLRYAGLDALPTARVSPGGVDHALRCATVGRLLERRHGLSRVLTEREILAAERLAEEPIASARMCGPRRRRHARPPLHRPDFAVLSAGHPLTADRYPAAYDRTRRRGGGDPSDIPGAHQREVSEAEALTRGRGISDDHGRRPAEAEDIRVVAVEVELTPKSPGRLVAIMLAWYEAGWVSGVHYLCEPGPTRRAVERAVLKMQAGRKVAISEVPR